jgi:hypothetical protein
MFLLKGNVQLAVTPLFLKQQWQPMSLATGGAFPWAESE